MREPTEMELRVAKAMAEFVKKPLGNIASLEPVLVGSLGDAWPYIARAAIRAMRNPTKKIVLAGADAYSDFEDSDRDSYGTHRFVRPGHEVATFNAMIDAASPPEDRK